MSRIKIELPGTFSFSTKIPIRITDINYGGHLGNDTVLSLIHEARMQFLNHFGYSEMELEGVGMIMADASIEFKNEVFYGDTIVASVAVSNPGKVSFDIYYKLEKEIDEKLQPVAFAKTGMVCYNYQKKKITALPGEVMKKMFKREI